MDTPVSVGAKCLQAFRELMPTFFFSVCQGASTRWRRTACLWTMCSVRTCSRKTSGTWRWRPCTSSSQTTSPARPRLWASAPHHWFTTSTHRYCSSETRVEVKCCWIVQQSWWSSTNYLFRTSTVAFFFNLFGTKIDFFRGLQCRVFFHKGSILCKIFILFWVFRECVSRAWWQTWK